jgi:hypothetical protein
LIINFAPIQLTPNYPFARTIDAHNSRRLVIIYG